MFSACGSDKKLRGHLPNAYCGPEAISFRSRKQTAMCGTSLSLQIILYSIHFPKHIKERSGNDFLTNICSSVPMDTFYI